MTEIAATASHAEILAALHAACFPGESWSADAMRSILAIPGTFGLIALDEAEQPAGLLLARGAAGDIEILTLGVAPGSRRAGLGRRLLARGLAEAGAAGATRVFLEVAEDNEAALALYRKAGFAPIGRRPDYYRGPGGRRDALTLRRLLGVVPEPGAAPRLTSKSE
jgi:ribosomal-protein-alanine N-acetyltransferase